MQHVFVETNWVVAYASPNYLRRPEALELGERARVGQLKLYLPSPCIAEAKRPIRVKSQTRGPANIIRSYVEWARRENKIDQELENTVYLFLDRYQSTVQNEVRKIEDRLLALTQHPGIEVFALSEPMLTRAIDLSMLNLDLKPFDQVVLAAVLVKAEQLQANGATDIAFCELDSDLQPWKNEASQKDLLTALYDSAHVWVYGDFEMKSPPKPANLW